MSAIPILGTLTLSGAVSIIRKEHDYIQEHQIAGKDGGLVERVGSANTEFEIKGIIYDSGAEVQYKTLVAMSGTTQNLSIPFFNSGYYFSASGTKVTVQQVGANWVPGYGYPRYDYSLKLVATGAAPILPLVPILVQKVVGNTAGTYQLSLNISAAVGNKLIVVFLISTSDHVITGGPTISDSVGNTWTTDVSENAGLQSDLCFIASTTNISASANTIVASNGVASSVGEIAMAVYEYSNFPASAPSIAVTTSSPFIVTQAAATITFWAYENGGSASLITLNTGSTDETTPANDGLGYLGRGAANLSSSSAKLKGASAQYG